MKSLITIAAFVGLTLSASNSFAQASYGYGMAGCGLGTQLFRAEPGMGPQLMQVTTNKFASQTSAVTTGSSGCEESPREVASLYITINYAALMKDVSRGNGETISNLSSIYECNNAISLGDTLRNNYKVIFDSNITTEKASKKIESIIINNNLSCKALS